MGETRGTAGARDAGYRRGVRPTPDWLSALPWRDGGAEAPRVRAAAFPLPPFCSFSPHFLPALRLMRYSGPDGTDRALRWRSSPMSAPEVEHEQHEERDEDADDEPESHEAEPCRASTARGGRAIIGHPFPYWVRSSLVPSRQALPSRSRAIRPELGTGVVGLREPGPGHLEEAARGARAQPRRGHHASAEPHEGEPDRGADHRRQRRPADHSVPELPRPGRVRPEPGGEPDRSRHEHEEARRSEREEWQHRCNDSGNDVSDAERRTHVPTVAPNDATAQARVATRSRTRGAERRP